MVRLSLVPLSADVRFFSSESLFVGTASELEPEDRELDTLLFDHDKSGRLDNIKEYRRTRVLISLFVDGQ